MTTEPIPFPQTFDSRVWAQGFVKTAAEHPKIVGDEETMTTWFANAIMVGYDQREREERHGLEPNHEAPERVLSGED